MSERKAQLAIFRDLTLSSTHSVSAGRWRLQRVTHPSKKGKGEGVQQQAMVTGVGRANNERGGWVQLGMGLTARITASEARAKASAPKREPHCLTHMQGHKEG